MTRNFIVAHKPPSTRSSQHHPDTQVGITLAVTDFQAADEASQQLRDRVHHRMVQVYYDAIRDGWIRGPRIEEEVARHEAARTTSSACSSTRAA